MASKRPEPKHWTPIPSDPDDPRHQVGYWYPWAVELAKDPKTQAHLVPGSERWAQEERYRHRRRKSLLAYADRSDPIGCWPWHGPYFMDQRRGKLDWYGSFSWHNYRVGAHRASFMIHNGPLPANLGTMPHLVVDHLCCVPWCVQPLHLDLVPIGYNTWRFHHRLPHQFREATSFKQPAYEQRYRIRPLSAQNEKWSHLEGRTTPAGR